MFPLWQLTPYHVTIFPLFCFQLTVTYIVFPLQQWCPVSSKCPVVFLVLCVYTEMVSKVKLAWEILKKKRVTSMWLVVSEASASFLVFLHVYKAYSITLDTWISKWSTCWKLLPSVWQLWCMCHLQIFMK